MFRRTKIICTLGPAVDSYEKILDLVRAGMNVARVNCSHSTSEQRKRWVEWTRKASEEENTYVGILFDLSGPKFRLGEIPGNGLEVSRGQEIEIGTSPGQLPILEKKVLERLRKGSQILIGDGEVSFRVKTIRNDKIILSCQTGGLVRSRQGITLVGQSFDVPALTDQDKRDLKEGLELGVDFVAQSYVRSEKDVLELAELIRAHDSPVQIVSKIETKQAVDSIEKILSVSDCVMVARGDLGLQMSIEDVPIVQKKIIALARNLGKPVITATQMLESMIEFPRPTRAEATDVANAILDGTDATMLSAETAVGKYPIEATRQMHRLAIKTEKSATFQKATESQRFTRNITATESVAKAACEMAQALDVKAILSFSITGFTARMVSKCRPRVPILCATYRVRTARQVSLLWGVRPLITEEFYSTEEMISHGFAASIREKILSPHDTVIITAGIPVGKPGATNMVTLMKVFVPEDKR
ncbi:MAG TPA: pyruvate kinase [Fimbriimonadales bacterium]|nr:pyruvate kinase [Fimbriimonadales bacterium]